MNVYNLFTIQLVSGCVCGSLVFMHTLMSTSSDTEISINMLLASFAKHFPSNPRFNEFFSHCIEQVLACLLASHFI